MASNNRSVVQTKENTKKAYSGKANIYTWEQMLEVPKDPEWIIKDLFVAGSVVTVYGDGGSKKTYAMIDMAICLMSKSQWLNFDIPKPLPVLIIDEESGKDRLSRRYIEARNGHNIKKSLPITTTCMSGFDLRDKDDLQELENIIIVSQAKLVIIDTLMNVIPGGDDNSSKDMNPFFQGLRKVADRNKLVIIVIHHANKLNGYRGSTAIKGGSDLLIQISSKPNSPNIDFKTEKERDIPHTEWAAVSYLEKGNKFFLSSSVKKMARLGKSQEHVLYYLSQYQDVTMNDLKENHGKCSPSSVRDAAYKLKDFKYVEDGGWKGKSRIIQLTELGNNYVEMYLPSPIENLANV